VKDAGGSEGGAGVVAEAHLVGDGAGEKGDALLVSGGVGVAHGDGGGEGVSDLFEGGAQLGEVSGELVFVSAEVGFGARAPAELTEGGAEDAEEIGLAGVNAAAGAEVVHAETAEDVAPCGDGDDGGVAAPDLDAEVVAEGDIVLHDDGFALVEDAAHEGGGGDAESAGAFVAEGALLIHAEGAGDDGGVRGAEPERHAVHAEDGGGALDGGAAEVVEFAEERQAAEEFAEGHEAAAVVFFAGVGAEAVAEVLVNDDVAAAGSGRGAEEDVADGAVAAGDGIDLGAVARGVAAGDVGPPGGDGLATPGLVGKGAPEPKATVGHVVEGVAEERGEGGVDVVVAARGGDDGERDAEDIGDAAKLIAARRNFGRSAE